MQEKRPMQKHLNRSLLRTSYGMSRKQVMRDCQRQHGDQNRVLVGEEE